MYEIGTYTYNQIKIRIICTYIHMLKECIYAKESVSM